MRKLRFSPTPTKPRYFVLGGSAALGQQGVDIKVSINWPTEKLGQGVSVLPEKLFSFRKNTFLVVTAKKELKQRY